MKQQSFLTKKLKIQKSNRLVLREGAASKHADFAIEPRTSEIWRDETLSFTNRSLSSIQGSRPPASIYVPGQSADVNRLDDGEDKRVAIGQLVQL